MKLFDIKPVSEGMTCNMLFEDVQSLIQTVLGKAKAGKIDRNDKETVNQISLIVALYQLYKHYHEGRLSKDELVQKLRNVQGGRVPSGYDLDLIYREVGGSEKNMETRDQMINALSSDQPKTPDEAAQKQTKKGAVIRQLTDLQNQFYTALRGPGVGTGFNKAVSAHRILGSTEPDIA